MLQDKAKREQDELAKTIAARQYADWRELRFEEFTSPQLRKALAKMAQQIMEALERSQAEASRQQPEKESEKPSSSANTFQSSGGPQPAPAQIRVYDLAKEAGLKSKDLADRLVAMGYPVKSPSSTIDNEMAENIRRKVLSKVAAEIKIKTLVVDQQCLGDYVTITEALKAAKPGTRILVRPGLYNEGIIIDKPVKIIGDGERSEIVIEGNGRCAIVFVADNGRVANFTLRQIGSDDWYGVDIAQGRLELDNCDISSQGNACVAIHSGATPHLQYCRIHKGKLCGVFITERGQGVLEDNEIIANSGVGVLIKAKGYPTLRRNRIYQNGKEGIYVGEGGGGIFEDNDLRGNAKGAWYIAQRYGVQRWGNKE